MIEKRTHGLKTVWFFLKPYKIYLFILLGLCLIIGLLETLHMALLYPILNASLESGGVGDNNLFFRILNDVAEIVPVDDVLVSSCILFVILTILYSASRLLYANLSPRVTAKIVREYEQEVFRKYTTADYRFFIDNRQGDLIYRGSQAPQFIGNTVIALTISAVEIILAVFVLLLLVSISWRGTIAVVLAGAGYYYFTRYLSSRISYVTGKGMRRAIENENVIMNEYITGVKQIRATQSSAEWGNRFNKAATSRWKHWSKNLFWTQVPTRFLELSMFGAIAIIVIVIKVQYPDKFFSMIPMFGTFAFAVFKLLPKLSATGTMLMNVSNWLPNLEAVQELLSDKTYSQIKNGDTELVEFKSSIEFKDVSFTYTGRESTLNNISIGLKKDNMTAIVGPSGSGKSTIVDLLLRLYDVGEGEIIIDGINIKDYDISTFLAEVGFVGQETFIFNASITDNIAFGNDYPEAGIIEAAKLANAHEFIEQLPEAYATIVGDRGLRLSGGEKQRIAIARAMLRKPQILILDEATSSLDVISETIVQKAIDQVSENCTTLVIAHRLSTIRNANKIYVLDCGQIVESGTHEQLINEQGK
ncbi:MAG: ABC transporter ATP-binding protein, partial [Planctomycetes bacterium]|nr:ABC transporter ATP-binding protein [Planctomycetota bacterium]